MSRKLILEAWENIESCGGWDGAWGFKGGTLRREEIEVEDWSEESLTKAANELKMRFNFGVTGIVPIQKCWGEELYE